MSGQQGFAQALESYVIISFEDVYKISNHKIKTYHWIVEIDSIQSYDIQPSYLFFNFSKQNLEDCCKGIEVDPFLVFPNSKYEIDSLHVSDINKLSAIIAKNKRKVLEVKKNWTSGQKETITIYATPVIGKFCSSNFHKIGQQRQGYTGRVFMPFSSFEYQSKFWQSPESKFILNIDLSKIKFDAITY
jgi:hypothetical protein